MLSFFCVRFLSRILYSFCDKLFHRQQDEFTAGSYILIWQFCWKRKGQKQDFDFPKLPFFQTLFLKKPYPSESLLRRSGGFFFCGIMEVPKLIESLTEASDSSRGAFCLLIATLHNYQQYSYKHTEYVLRLVLWDGKKCIRKNTLAIAKVSFQRSLLRVIYQLIWCKLGVNSWNLLP